jgi:hypothetical protein
MAVGGAEGAVVELWASGAPEGVEATGSTRGGGDTGHFDASQQASTVAPSIPKYASFLRDTARA